MISSFTAHEEKRDRMCKEWERNESAQNEHENEAQK